MSARADQMNKANIAVIVIWQRRVMKLYSTTSNKNQTSVTPARTAPEIFLSFHNNKSATAIFELILCIVNYKEVQI